MYTQGRSSHLPIPTLRVSWPLYPVCSNHPSSLVMGLGPVYPGLFIALTHNKRSVGLGK